MAAPSLPSGAPSRSIWPPAPNAACAPRNFARSGTRWTIFRCSRLPLRSMLRCARALPPSRAPRLLGLAAVAEARICRYGAGCHFGLDVFHAAGCTDRTQAPMSRYRRRRISRMIRDLPVLENYDVLSKFDALSELPVRAGCRDRRSDERNQVMKTAIPIRRCFGCLPEAGWTVRPASGKGSD